MICIYSQSGIAAVLKISWINFGFKTKTFYIQGGRQCVDYILKNNRVCVVHRKGVSYTSPTQTDAEELAFC